MTFQIMTLCAYDGRAVDTGYRTIDPDEPHSGVLVGCESCGGTHLWSTNDYGGEVIAAWFEKEQRVRAVPDVTEVLDAEMRAILYPRRRSLGDRLTRAFAILAIVLVVLAFGHHFL